MPGGSDWAAAAPSPAQAGVSGVKIGISDTGLQPKLSQYAWMTDVTGDPDRPGQTLCAGTAAHPAVRRVTDPRAGTARAHGTQCRGVLSK